MQRVHDSRSSTRPTADLVADLDGNSRLVLKQEGVAQEPRRKGRLPNLDNHTSTIEATSNTNKKTFPEEHSMGCRAAKEQAANLRISEQDDLHRRSHRKPPYPPNLEQHANVSLDICRRGSAASGRSKNQFQKFLKKAFHALFRV